MSTREREDQSTRESPEIRPAPRRRARPHWLVRLLHPSWLAIFGRTKPLSELWGYDRGQPVDRYYIESFLARHRQDIRGAVLEVKSADYTRRFGSDVRSADVVDIDASNPRATIVADLAEIGSLEAERFDCCIVTQTLHCIFDLHSAIENLRRSLRPGGVLLATFPSLSRIYLDGDYPDYWRLTPMACQRAFGRVFGEENTEVFPRGNLLTAMGTLTGMAREDLSRAKVEENDPRFPVVVGIRAIRRDGASL